MKHSRENFPGTNGWQFFDLHLAQGTNINTGEQTVNFQGVKRSELSPTRGQMIVCERSHG